MCVRAHFFHPVLTLSVKVLSLCPDPFVLLITQSGSSVTRCCQISVYFLAFFFLKGMPLCYISFPVLISSSPAQSPWSFSSASQFQLHTQCSSKSLFSCQVLLFLPHLLLTLLPHHSHILSFFTMHSLSCIFLHSHPVLPLPDLLSVIHSLVFLKRLV